MNETDPDWRDGFGTISDERAETLLAITEESRRDRSVIRSAWLEVPSEQVGEIADES